MRIRVSDSTGPGFEADTSELDGLGRVVGLGRFFEALIGRRGAPAECPVCGWKKSQYKTTGLLGCGACYETLSVE